MIRRWVRSAAQDVATLMLGAALVGLLVPATLGAQEVELRWRFEPGADLIYRHVQTTRSSAAMVGETHQTQTFTMRQRVLAVASDGAADVRVTYESMQFVQDGPMGHQEFDSESGEPPADPMAMMLSQLVGVSFEMTVAPDGEVRRVTGMEGVADAMAAGAAGHGPEAAAMIRSTLDGMFTDETMRSMMQQGTQNVPDGPVAAGATWRQTTSFELPFGTMRSDVHYTLDEVVAEQGRRIARISMRGTTGRLESNPNSALALPVETPGGEMTGGIDFDVDRGLLLRATFSTNMDASSMGQSVHVESTMEMTLVEG